MSNSSSSNQTASTNQVNFSEHNVSGFYHDLQKKNRLMSVTLHPSTVTEDKGVTWTKVTEGIGKGDIKYRKEPIATAILKEDFTIAIANSWTDFNGGDTLNQIWNSVRPFAAYASYAAEHLQKMSDAGHELGDLGNTAVKFIENAIDTALPYVKKGVDYLNRSLVVQGSRFSYYGGTGTSFGNLAMKFTLFADWKEVSEGSYTYKTVHDQLIELNPYLMGKYVKWDGEDSNNSLNQFIGWQKPPGGFKADVKNVDNFVEGTLLLNFGGYYCIPNIVIRDAQFVFSKQMVKDPNKPNTISPLSCDVTLTLQPATKFSDVMLFDFCNGTYTSDDVKKIQDDLTAKLKAIQTKNEQIFGNVTPMVDSEIQRPEGSESMTDYDRPMFT